MMKNYSHIIAFLTGLFSILNLQAQPSLIWAKQIGSTSNERGHSIIVDANGNVYTTGYFQGTTDFDPGPGVYNLTSTEGAIFVSKLDVNGNFIWAEQMGSGGTSCWGMSIAVDASGNVYTTGRFAGIADFDPGVGIYNLTSAGNQDIFVSKLDINGNFIWAKSMGGVNTSATEHDRGWCIAVDNSGNVYTTGDFDGTADFDPGPGVYNLTSAGATDIFISKLDANGNFVWAKQIGGGSTSTANDYGRSVVVDVSGNVYVTGWFNYTVDFDPGPGVNNLVSSGAPDIFVLKLDANGNFMWVKQMGGVSSDYGESIAIDADGNVYTTGRFLLQGTNPADFDPGPGVYNLTSTGSHDIFVSKLDNNGNFVWAKNMGGTGNDYADYGRSIAVDAVGNVYTSGRFQNTADFDPGPGVYNLTSAGQDDIFVSKLDANGNFLCAASMGGAGTDKAYSLALDGNGNSYITGYFNGIADFDPGVGTYNLTSFGGTEIFVTKLELTCSTSPLTANFSSSDSTICETDCIDFTDLSSGSPISWSWYFPGSATPTSSVQNPANICYPTAGSYDVALTVSDGSNSDSIFMPNFITVGTLPNAGSNGTATLCAGSSGVDLLDSLGGTPDNGGTWSGSSGLTGGDQGTFDPGSNTAGTYTYTVTNSCGSSNSDVVVTINPLDDPSFNFTQASYCLTDPNPTPTVTGLTGGTFSIDNGGIINTSTGEIDILASGAGTYTVTYLTNGPCPQSTIFAINLTSAGDATITAAGPFCETDAVVTLTSVDGGGVWAGPGITDANLGTFDPASAGAGTHNVSYTISGSCGDTDNINIVVNATDDPSFNYAQILYCVSDADPIPTITGLAGGTFSIDNGGTIDLSTGVIDLDASGAGTYVVTYTTNGSCPDVATFNITISAGGNPAITPAGPYCVSDPQVSLGVSAPGGTWSGNGITDPNLGTFNPATVGGGIHEIIYTLSGACGGADTINIEVYAAPIVTTDGPHTISWGSFVTINASGATSYSWTPDTDLSCNDCANPAASPSSTTTYCVIGYNGTCSDTACTTITVDFDCGDVYVPTAFTPNSGDVNSLECVMGGCIIDMHLRVYDRWGELVFESFGQETCWDGTHARNGKPMSTATFVYILDATLATGETMNKKGNVSLIR